MSVESRIQAVIDRYKKLKPAPGQKSLWTDEDEKKHPRDENGEFSSKVSSGIQSGRDASNSDAQRPESKLEAAMSDYKTNGVKAKAFKDWFGDWEHDPENSSKVVDADGKPKETAPISGQGSKVLKDGKPVAVYHGTKAGGWESFKKEKIGKDLLYGPGFYFTEDTQVASEYAGRQAVPIKAFHTQEEAEDHMAKYVAGDPYTKSQYEDFAIKKQTVGLKRPQWTIIGYRKAKDSVEYQWSEDVFSNESRITDTINALDRVLAPLQRAYEADPKAVEKNEAAMGRINTLKGVRRMLAKQWLNPRDREGRDGLKSFFDDPLEHNRGVMEQVQKLANFKVEKTVRPAEIKQVFLNIRKPFDADQEYIKLSDVKKHLPVAYARWQSLFSNTKNKEMTERFTKEEIEKLDESSEESYDNLAYTYPKGGEWDGKDAVNWLLQKIGYDGITHVGGNRLGGGHEHRVWIAFDPAQVKSVDNRGTFDQKDERMDYSKRMDMESRVEAMIRRRTGKPELEKKPHEFSSIQIDLPKELAEKVRAMASQIPNEELAEDGREEHPHITALFGLHTDNPDDVKECLYGQRPVEIVFGETSLFQNPDADVLKIEILGEGIHDLNQRLKKLEHTSTHPGYKPHCTIAYLKPGMGKKYTGSDALNLLKFMADEVQFSDKHRKKTAIDLISETKQIGDRILRAKEVCEKSSKWDESKVTRQPDGTFQSWTKAAVQDKRNALHCPFCGSENACHARTQGNGNAVCYDCRKVFDDADDGKRKSGIPMIVDFQMDNYSKRIRAVMDRYGKGKKPASNQMAMFEEDQHPRDDSGKFTTGKGSTFKSEHAGTKDLQKFGMLSPDWHYEVTHDVPLKDGDSLVDSRLVEQKLKGDKSPKLFRISVVQNKNGESRSIVEEQQELRGDSEKSVTAFREIKDNRVLESPKYDAISKQAREMFAWHHSSPDEKPSARISVPGMQKSLFERQGGQKTLFDYVPPKRTDAKKAKAADILDGVDARLKRLLQKKETVSPADIAHTILQHEPLPGQKDLF